MITAAVAMETGGREKGAHFYEDSHRRLIAVAEAGDLNALREELSAGSWLVLGPDAVTAAAKARSIPCLAHILDERKCTWNPSACARAAVEGTRERGENGGNTAIAALEYIFEKCKALPCRGEHIVRQAAIMAAARAHGVKDAPRSLEHLLHTYPTPLEDVDFLDCTVHEAIYAGNLGALWVLWEAGAEMPYTDTEEVPPAYIEDAAWERVKSFWEDGWAAEWAAGRRPPPSVKPAIYS